jgi:WD40 repeat protein
MRLMEELVCLALEQHEYLVWSVVFSLNGKCIMLGSYNRLIQVWDTEMRSQYVYLPQEVGHTSFLISASHTCIDLSNDPDTMHLPSGELHHLKLLSKLIYYFS